MSESAAKAGQAALPAEMYKELDAFIGSLEVKEGDARRKGHLIRVLHRAQEIFGYLPVEVQKHVAAGLHLHHSEVSGVISFYNFFTTQPKGRKRISICMGTACYVKGADKVLKEFEKELGISSGSVSEDMEFSIDVLRCVGACGLAPVVMVNDKVYGRVQPENVKDILAEIGGNGGEQNG